MEAATMDTIIRAATPQDEQRVIEMGSRSLRIGPYKDELKDEPDVTRRLYGVLINNPQARIIVAERGGLVVGVFAMILFPHYYSGELTAGEIIWYVEPEYRGMTALGKSIAYDLLHAAEDFAKGAGAVRMQLTAPSEGHESLYKRIGYHKLEVSFQRKL